MPKASAAVGNRLRHPVLLLLLLSLAVVAADLVTVFARSNPGTLSAHDGSDALRRSGRGGTPSSWAWRRFPPFSVVASPSATGVSPVLAATLSPG